MTIAGHLIGALVAYAAMGGVGYLIAAVTKAQQRRKQQQTTGEN